MAAWAQVGVIYDDQKCSCGVSKWNDKRKKLLGD